MNYEHTIWMTGLSMSGKTALANSLACFLRSFGRRIQIIDGKSVRDELGDFFGYTKEERMKVNRVLCSMARLLARNQTIPIVTSITPYQESRDFNRAELKPYIEIYVECSLEICSSRDDRGIYIRAMRGDLRNFIGVDDPYEIPRNPDFRVCTSQESLDESSRKICAFIAGILGINNVREMLCPL